MSRKGAGIVASGRARGINFVSAESYRWPTAYFLIGIAKYFYTPVTSIDGNVQCSEASCPLIFGWDPVPRAEEGSADRPD